MEDQDFARQIARFEEMCEPAIAKAKLVLGAVLTESQVPVTVIDSVEIVGGVPCVPWPRSSVRMRLAARNPPWP